MIPHILISHSSHIDYTLLRPVIPGALDVTGTQMVMVMKLSSFAYDCYDGLVLKKDVSSSLASNRVDF